MAFKPNGSYQEAEAYIFATPKFTRKNTMEDTGLFYEFLGSPGEGQKIIHVAGTNGKGSVCSYLNTILGEAGQTVGMFTSPHLVKLTERFVINGEDAAEEELLEAFRQVMDKVTEYGKKYHPTFFELLFFMAMVLFEKRKVDFIILETGLGGRLDATNIIKAPQVCVITEIGMDHMEYLGDTLEKIAGEKAGIIKEGIPVVYQADKTETAGIIASVIQSVGAKGIPVSGKNWEILHKGKKYIDFSLQSSYYSYIRLILSTGAVYQVENAALAVAAAEILGRDGLITKEQIEAGILSTHWPGRMEEILPDIYVDGAHNEDGMQAFLETVKQDGCTGRRMLLFSMVGDKNYHGIIRLIYNEQVFDEIIIAQMKDYRSASVRELEKIFKRCGNVPCSTYEDVEMAFTYAKQRQNPGDYVYIAGSLYLVGQVKELLKIPL